MHIGLEHYLVVSALLFCLGLLGVTKYSELDRSYVRPAAPANVPHVLSAFPLLQIDEYRY